MAWAKNGSTTLSSAGDTITISSLTANKTNLFLVHTIASGNVEGWFRLGSGSIDSGAVYADRKSQNGAADITNTSGTKIVMVNNDTPETQFGVLFVFNLATEEKLGIFYHMNNYTGAGSAPLRNEGVFKYVNTSNQFDQAQALNTNTGDYATNSNLSALGSELTPASATTIETGSIYIDTDTNQRYFWNGSSWSLQA